MSRGIYLQKMNPETSLPGNYLFGEVRKNRKAWMGAYAPDLGFEPRRPGFLVLDIFQ